MTKPPCNIIPQTLRNKTEVNPDARHRQQRVATSPANNTIHQPLALPYGKSRHGQVYVPAPYMRKHQEKARHPCPDWHSSHKCWRNHFAQFLQTAFPPATARRRAILCAQPSRHDEVHIRKAQDSTRSRADCD